MKLKVGQTLASVTDATTVIVVRSGQNEVSLTCGGAEMTDPGIDAERHAISDGADGGTQLGKRYVDEADTLELLCTKNGQGTLAVDGSPLGVKSAKALPSSD
jgi:hypothetical protein